MTSHKVKIERVKAAIAWLRELARNPDKAVGIVPIPSVLTVMANALAVSGETASSEKEKRIIRYFTQEVGVYGLASLILRPWLSPPEICKLLGISISTFSSHSGFASRSIDSWLTSGGFNKEGEFYSYQERRNRITLPREKLLDTPKKAEVPVLQLKIGSVPWYLMSIRVDDVPMSTRTLKCLWNDNIVYLGDLVGRTEAEMLRVPNLGTQSMEEIKNFLGERGLALGMDNSDWVAMITKHWKEVGPKVEEQKKKVIAYKAAVEEDKKRVEEMLGDREK